MFRIYPVCCFPRGVLKASLDDVESMEGLLELDDTMPVMIISDENEMGQVRQFLRRFCVRLCSQYLCAAW